MLLKVCRRQRVLTLKSLLPVFAAKSGGVQECDASMPNSGTVDGPITAILHGFVISKIKKLIATCFAYFCLAGLSTFNQ